MSACNCVNTLTCVEEKAVGLCRFEEHGEVVAGAGYGASPSVGEVVGHILRAPKRRLGGRLLCGPRGSTCYTGTSWLRPGYTGSPWNNVHSVLSDYPLHG